MRHQVKVKKIGRDAKHRKSILRNLTKALIYKERIETTIGKIKVFQSFVEKIITRAKVDTLHNRRMVYRDVRDTQLLKKLFENISKRYLERPGGYTRIIKLGDRRGDGSQRCLLELVEENLSVDKNLSSSKKTQTAGPKENSKNLIKGKKKESVVSKVDQKEEGKSDQSGKSRAENESTRPEKI